ncbi:hypothetical protein L2E82_48516 [Cichorium intybus]|uniref:Uncharacterized protein n=1 Tax=Cichorium intybus TaxID=13427 RepID=A0ACB8YZK0_CICIN|nr:hypothetical protein L2E82_48516 [Cichorium intybus]
MAAVAVRVFGNPINHGTRAQRALAAKNNQNADGKLDQALLVLNQQQKAAAGRPNENVTFGMIYNATGGDLTYRTSVDWSGKVVGQYPMTILTGQWVMFLSWAYCEMNDPGYIGDRNWEEIYQKLIASGTECQASMEGYTTKVSIDAEGNTPTFTALFYLDV